MSGTALVEAPGAGATICARAEVVASVATMPSETAVSAARVTQRILRFMGGTISASNAYV
jgi:hypothetical protein